MAKSHKKFTKPSNLCIGVVLVRLEARANASNRETAQAIASGSRPAGERVKYVG